MRFYINQLSHCFSSRPLVESYYFFNFHFFPIFFFFGKLLKNNKKNYKRIVSRNIFCLLLNLVWKMSKIQTSIEYSHKIFSPVNKKFEYNSCKNSTKKTRSILYLFNVVSIFLYHFIDQNVCITHVLLPREVITLMNFHIVKIDY